MTTITPTQARDFARQVAYFGHVKGVDHVARLAARAGLADAEPAGILAAAVAAGMLVEVPRIGGYVASKRTNAAVFGRAYAEWVAA